MIQIQTGFTTGVITVKAQNCVGNSTTVTLTVNSVPATPGAISGPVSSLKLKTGVIYSISAVGSATSYTWTLGNGVDNTNQNQGTISFPASGLTTGTYTYTVNATSSEGCISSAATATLDIIDVPNANFDLSDLFKKGK